MGLNHSPDSRTEVKERVEICLYFPSGALMACNTAKLKISYVINFQYLLAQLDSVVCLFMHDQHFNLTSVQFNSIIEHMSRIIVRCSVLTS
jgi:hypothetical protein